MQDDRAETVLTLRDLVRFPTPVSAAASQGVRCPFSNDEGGSAPEK